MKPFKPENYNSLSAYLIVDDADRLANQLTEIFDAKVMRRFAAAAPPQKRYSGQPDRIFRRKTDLHAPKKFVIL